jgi:hypothetical protein
LGMSSYERHVILGMTRCGLRSPDLKTKLCYGTGKAPPKLGRLVTETCFCNLRKQANLGWACQFRSRVLLEEPGSGYFLKFKVLARRLSLHISTIHTYVDLHNFENLPFSCMQIPLYVGRSQLAETVSTPADRT